MTVTENKLATLIVRSSWFFLEAPKEKKENASTLRVSFIDYTSRYNSISRNESFNVSSTKIDTMNQTVNTTE